MHNRIKELARKANMVEVEYCPGFPDIKYPANFEKFAELIVKECAELFDKNETEVRIPEHRIHESIMIHFGLY